MTAAALTAAPTGVDYAPMVNKEYRRTRIGRHIIDWVAYLELGQHAERYIDDCERTLSYIALTWPDIDLCDLTDGHLAHALKVKPRPTQGKMRHHLSSFYKWAELTDRVPNRKAVDRLPKPRPQRRKHRDIFTEAEIDDLFALPILDAGLMALLFGAGLRKSEAGALQVRRVTVEPPASVTVLGGKGNKDRSVLLDAEAAQLVREFLLFHPLDPQDFFWYSRPGGGERVHHDRELSGTAFENWWTKSLAKAGVRYRNPHMARHTYATRYLRASGRLETLSGQMGHESIRTTFDLYAHLDESDVLEDMARIDLARRNAKDKD